MSDTWRFTVHKNERFDKLIPQLCQVGIAELMKSSNTAYQLQLKDTATFLEIFKIVFLLYVTPNEPHIKLKTGKVITQGKFVNIALTEDISPKAQEVLNVLITAEDDPVYEEAFNALIAVYIGSLMPLEFIFPNTYIIELGRHTHELDIFCGVQYPECIIVETTRGFTKEFDNIRESYAWHFKKAIFRKWMLEKLYHVKCQLWYITLQGQFQGETSPDELPDELKEEQDVIESTNKLFDAVLDYERDGIHIIDLGEFHNIFSIQRIESLLHTHLLQKIQELLLSQIKTS